MKSSNQTSDELRESGVGIGSRDEATLAQRARELARIEGRDEPDESDLAEAREDLLTIGARPAAPEAPLAEDFTAWDTPSAATGVQAAGSDFDDEANIAEKLVEEGIEEADHDRRIAASKEQGRDEE